MKYLLGLLVILLLLAHQDYWQWNRQDLVYGFIPYNMAWHMGLSLVTAIVWVAVCVLCWPGNLEHTKSNEADGIESGEKAGGP